MMDLDEAVMVFDIFFDLFFLKIGISRMLQFLLKEKFGEGEVKTPIPMFVFICFEWMFSQNREWEVDGWMCFAVLGRAENTLSLSLVSRPGYCFIGTLRWSQWSKSMCGGGPLNDTTGLGAVKPKPHCCSGPQLVWKAEHDKDGLRWRRDLCLEPRVT